MLIYSLSVVQVGDKVSIDSGFQLAAQNIYTVAKVTSKFFDVVSSAPLANETGILPGSSGMTFFSQAKRFIRLESDQDTRIYINGSTDLHQYISPWVASDPEQVGWIELCGPVWRVTVYNRSFVPMTITFISVE
jgi:hypothetical protein